MAQLNAHIGVGNVGGGVDGINGTGAHLGCCDMERVALILQELKVLHRRLSSSNVGQIKSMAEYKEAVRELLHKFGFADDAGGCCSGGGGGGGGGAFDPGPHAAKTQPVSKSSDSPSLSTPSMTPKTVKTRPTRVAPCFCPRRHRLCPRCRNAL